jgi:uracil-DNA glycosylase
MQIRLENVKIEPSWKEILKDEFLSPYFLTIKENLLSAMRSGVVYPPSNLIFNAFELTPFDSVKVVILGQDPYHGANQAMGLSFSVPRGVKIPPSLLNIYKEIYDDLGIKQPNCGDLTYWAKQGVLLLNTTLSVSAGVANSHSNFGWQIFTDAIIRAINARKNGIVFLLWGNPAKAKSALIDTIKHFVLSAAHPSPLARGAFFGCRHFSKTNEILTRVGKTPIDWDLNHYFDNI